MGVHDRPYFIEWFPSRSSTPPCLLFVVERSDNISFYSLPQPHNPAYEKSSSLVLTPDCHMKFSGDIWPTFPCLTSDLLYLSTMYILTDMLKDISVICNTSTGRFKIIPHPKSRRSRNFLGFDPIDKQFKVLSIGIIDSDHIKIRTLGTGKMMWRNIQCPLTHFLWSTNICINGVLYYLTTEEVDEMYDDENDEMSLVIACFDVRSEKFKFIHVECFWNKYTQLINYKGKLGGISFVDVDPSESFTLQLRMWVLEDVEKQKLSEYSYTLSEIDRNVLVAGVTTTGEIVFSDYNYVYYFNPERNTLQTVKIQGNHQVLFDNAHKVHIFVDHVDLTFNIMRTTHAVTSIIQPEKKRKPTITSTSSKEDHRQKQDRCTFESINQFDALRLLDDDE